MVKYYTMCTLVDDVDGAPPGGAPESLAAQDAPQPELGTPPLQGQVTPEFTTSMDDDADRLDAFHGDSPVHYYHVDNILGEVEPTLGQAE
jgi:hypothetical protein